MTNIGMRGLWVLLLLLSPLSSSIAQDLWPDYAGKASCFGCHVSIKPIDLEEFNKSGHPWKIQRIDVRKVDANGVYKPFPAGTNESGVPLAAEVIALGFGYTAPDSNIAFMIGGFGWKARWMNKAGYIYEGTKAQYNLGTIHPQLQGHGSYNATNVNNAVFALRTPTGAKYDCGACHTTGWKKYDASTSPYRKDNLPGMDGTFFEYGVQCEGCHGPSKTHTQNPSMKPPKDGFDGCKDCHARGRGLRIPVKSGGQFLDHREQYDQMLFTKHRRSANMTCVTCHDPHKSTVYDRGGLKSTAKTCQPCHPNKEVSITIIRDGVPTSAPHTCRDCHMPYIGNTAVKLNNNRGDQASHMWKINTNPVSKFQGMWTADSLNVAIPPDSVVAHTLDFACLGCHTTRDLAWASGHAQGIHNKTIVVNVQEERMRVPAAYFVDQNYPNPLNPATEIRFSLAKSSDVRLEVYDIMGRVVATLVNEPMTAGYHKVTWDGRNNAGQAVSSGVYFYRITTGEFVATKKMVLIK